MELSLQIVNASTNIPASDPNTANLVYATWAIAIATIISIGVTAWLTRSSLKETRRSNSLLALELKAKFKPYLAFTKPELRHKPEDTTGATFSCLITNGAVSLSNILIYHFFDSTEISLYNLLTKESEIKKTERKVEGTLEPPRYHHLSFPINTDTRKDIWIAIWINYEYLDNIKEEGIAIYDFETPKGSGGFESLGSTGFKWFSHNDIQKARQEFSQNKGIPSGGL